MQRGGMFLEFCVGGCGCLLVRCEAEEYLLFQQKIVAAAQWFFPVLQNIPY